MTSANATQIGGEHYRSSHQHWDLMTDHGVPYLLGCATKYLVRARRKNGREDLQKALHYVQKARESSTQILLAYWDRPSFVVLEQFCGLNGVPMAEASILVTLLQARYARDLEAAETALQKLLRE